MKIRGIFKLWTFLLIMLLRNRNEQTEIPKQRVQSLGISVIVKNKANLAVFVISLIIFLTIVEFINYLVLLNNNRYYVWPPNLNKTFLPDSSVMKGITGASIFTINELGYRGQLIKNKEKEYRILTVGGSTTESLYLDNSETWPNLIMEKLNKTKNKKDIVVMNIGKSGHNTRDHILQLEHLIKTYEPDLIIFVF